MEYVTGYKAFNKGLINQFNETYEVGKDYTLNSDLKWKKKGFHFAENLEDVLRYYDGFGEIDICVVIGYGDIMSFYDDYYDYEIIVSDHMRIVKVLSREEILEYAKKLPDYRLCRFISGFGLNEDEQLYLTEGRSDLVQRYVRYFQCGEKDAFQR